MTRSAASSTPRARSPRRPTTDPFEPKGMMRKVLLIGGSLNQTRMMHQVARHLVDDFACHFTPFYADGVLDRLARAGVLDFTILGGPLRRATERYLAEEGLKVDERGSRHDYDLVVTGT